MKITAITHARRQRRDAQLGVRRVETDQPGLYGWGEATLEWKTRAVVGAVEDLAPLLIGRDPRDIEQLSRVLTKHGFWRLGVIGMSRGLAASRWRSGTSSANRSACRSGACSAARCATACTVYTHLGLGDMTRRL